MCENVCSGMPSISPKCSLYGFMELLYLLVCMASMYSRLAAVFDNNDVSDFQ